MDTVEARLPVARYVDRQLAGIGRYGLPTVAVAGVASTVFPGQMMIYLGIQGALGQCLLQGIQQPTLYQAVPASSPASN